MERCTGGSDCSDPTCFLMHPCGASNCHHYGKVWLTSDHFKYNANKRFKTCQEYSAIYVAVSAKYNAVTSERKRQRREEVELETFPELDLSEEGKAAAVTSAQKEFDLQLAGARAMYPSRVLSCNIFGASTGCKGYSIVQEGEKSTLTERGYDTPAIVASSSTPSRPWRALNGQERRQLGPPAAIMYDAGRSKELSKHVEKQLQLHAQQQPGLQPLWRVVGAGGPKGLPSYCVGVRFFPHLEDGSLPNGFFHTVPRAEMATVSVQADAADDDELPPALRGEYDFLTGVLPDGTALLEFDTPLPF